MNSLVADDQLIVGLIEAAPDAIVVVDESGTIVLVNAQTERVFDYRRDDILGRPLETLIPEHARDHHPDLRSRYLDDPRPRPMGASLALEGRRRDGTTFPAEISLSPVRVDAQILVAAAIRDVTDRKRADAKFRSLLEAAPDAMVCVDTEGRIAIVNAQTERLFGFVRDELVGQPVELLVPDAVRLAHQRHRLGYLDDPRPRPMGAGLPLTARRRDGTEFPAEISLGTLDTEEGLLVSAAIRDVTERLELDAERERLRVQAERERLEVRLQQSQRLESLGQLAGGVAHDFNNLLAVILNYAAFVKEQVDSAAVAGEPWVTVGADVGQIVLAAERAARLTHQLLAFARREVVAEQVIDLNDVVRDLEPLLRRTLSEHIELKTDLSQGLWRILADPGQIEQVLVNLAVNGRDAMTEGGTLTVETANVTADAAFVGSRPELEAGPYVLVRVSDTGSGMDESVCQRAFEPFFTTKPNGEGSGLGLATVYGVVTQAGGTVQIYSELGLGTSVNVLFPATDLTAAARSERVEARRAGAGRTVVVAEDEDAMREVTRRILDRNGYRVLSACNGAEAIEIVTSHPEPIDLLLTDVVMPHMLGKEVAERILELRPGIAVIYMSGYAQPVLGAKGTLEPGVSLVQKPFSERTLIAKVSEVLEE